MEKAEYKFLFLFCKSVTDSRYPKHLEYTIKYIICQLIISHKVIFTRGK